MPLFWLIAITATTIGSIPVLIRILACLQLVLGVVAFISLALVGIFISDTIHTVGCYTHYSTTVCQHTNFYFFFPDLHPGVK